METSMKHKFELLILVVILTLAYPPIAQAQQSDSATLDAIEPDPVISAHPEDLTELGVEPGELITIESRRGKVTAYARVEMSIQKGTMFMAFCYNEASANLITNEALDPSAKIPEFKFCAIRASAGGELATRIH